MTPEAIQFISDFSEKMMVLVIIIAALPGLGATIFLMIDWFTSRNRWQ